MVAGLNSTSVSGAPGTRAQITIRGENNLSGRTEPLWIVDGLPLLVVCLKTIRSDYVGTVMQDGVGNLMPEDIESITILKDATYVNFWCKSCEWGNCYRNQKRISFEIAIQLFGNI